MKIVAITINKGGVGKTMLSRSLGAAAASAGKLVLILDMDTQQNSTSWRRRRPAELPLPHVQFTTENDLPETLKRARDAGCDLVLIDTPPGRSTEAVAAVEEADPHYSREMRDQSQTVDIAHNYANGLFDEVFCNEISGPGVWWPRPISGGPMNYSG